jgi:hypothetical protein
VDVADGISQQVDLSFRQRTGTTYPLLLQASTVGALYGFTQHNYAVIDHEGILRYRSVGAVARRFNEQVIRQHIEEALDNLDAAILAGDKEREQLEATAGLEMSDGQPRNLSWRVITPIPLTAAQSSLLACPVKQKCICRFSMYWDDLWSIWWLGGCRSVFTG